MHVYVYTLWACVCVHVWFVCVCEHVEEPCVNVRGHVCVSMLGCEALPLFSSSQSSRLERAAWSTPCRVVGGLTAPSQELP